MWYTDTLWLYIISYPKIILGITPSPADYDVKVNNHVAGAVISKSNRFVDNLSTTSDTVSVVSVNSNSSCFRTVSSYIECRV